MDMPIIEEGDAAQIERAWLAAGKARDVRRMKELHERHPKWLALDRVRTPGDLRCVGTRCQPR
jgi:hypothetical protein